MHNHTYKYLPPSLTPNNERMDISVFNYFSTFTLGLMCYSFFNPGVAYDLSMFLAYTFARTMITGYDVYSKYIYRPYRKHIRRPMMNILNIDDGLYEIEIVKDGNIIHRFKTMADFIKYNPIKFICEDEDEEDDNDDSSSGSGSESEAEQSQSQPQPSSELETPIDADLTNANVDIHEPDTTNENCDEEEEVDDTEDKQSTEDEDEEEDGFNGDNIILEPTEYDFVLRTMYFEDDSVNVTFGFCLKYETFRKSDMKQKYTYDQLKDLVSKRRFIGIHLKTDSQDYIINLTNPINYYIEDNTILDYSFLKMYLYKRYNVILGNSYTLSCIDNFIEMYSLEQGKKILITKNVFKIIDDETYKTTEDSASSTDTESKSTNSIHPIEFINDADIEFVEYNYNK
uniref:Uncharacterized protein n=1 Tax=viral metagenome TaxID=1070528 RepID=A0A6C0EYL5_9ZZZZ